MARRKSGSGISRESIVEAGLAAIQDSNLTDWTVDMVAAKARCAKGLVLYHFKSKDALLLRIAERVRDIQADERLAALQAEPRGTPALDRLWTVLAGQVKSGSFGLWVGLLADPRTRKAAARSPEENAGLLEASARTLGVSEDSLALPLIPPGLDGISLQLLQGSPALRVRELYDRFWLGVLSGEL